MPHHRISAVCCFATLFIFFTPSDAYASRWQLSLLTKPTDQIDPVSLVFAFDEIPQVTDSMPGKYQSAIAWMENPVTPITAPTSAKSQSTLVHTEQIMLSNIQVQYLHTDLLGSVVLETDSNGNAIKSTAYKPFGESGNN